MNKLSRGAVALAAITCIGIAFPTVGAEAVAKKYSSCAKLHKKYSNGVALNQAAIDAASGLTGIPTINRKVYKANFKKLDRDRDGIACEV